MQPEPTLSGVAALDRSALIFAALGDETRLRLVVILCAGEPQSITQLTLGTAITRQAVTKHLQVLAQAGLVRDAKLGRERLWALELTQLAAARHSLELISRQWDPALGTLACFTER